MTEIERPDVLIVGGGPAGMMSALLLARAGVSVTVLEKHADFFRDFRGDTVHPSTMELLAQMGMLERFLRRPHNRVAVAEIRIVGRDYAIGDLSHLDTPAPFIAMMPQWEFLDFLRDESAGLPGYGLRMEAEAVGFLDDGMRIEGVKLADGRELRPKLLTLMCDGRSSLVREEGMLPLKQIGAPMDVFWFSLPKAPDDGGVLRGAETVTGAIQTGSLPLYMLVILGTVLFVPVVPLLFEPPTFSDDLVLADPPYATPAEEVVTVLRSLVTGGWLATSPGDAIDE